MFATNYCQQKDCRLYVKPVISGNDNQMFKKFADIIDNRSVAEIEQELYGIIIGDWQQKSKRTYAMQFDSD